MSALFPGAVRIFTGKVDIIDVVMAEHVNLLQDEVTAIEATLGTGLLASSWAGVFGVPTTHTTLTSRLTNIEAGISAVIASKADASTAATREGAQTLKNKTMSGADNSFSNIPISAISSLQTALDDKAPLTSPALTGNPTAPTQTSGNDSTRIATTAFVQAALSAAGVADGSIATAKLANKAVTYAKIQDVGAQYRVLGRISASAGVTEELTPNNLVTVLGQATDKTGSGKVVLDASPSLTGNPTVPTQTSGNNSTRAASTAFVQDAVSNSPTINNPFLAAPREKCTIIGTAPTGTIDVDLGTTSDIYFTTDAAANFTLNFRHGASDTLNSKLVVGDSISVRVRVTNGATPRYPNVIKIDGNTVTPKWQYAAAPAAGNANSIDQYYLTILKTANNAYLVEGSYTRFA